MPKQQDYYECPNCGYEIEINDVIEKNIRQAMEQDFATEKAQLVEKTKAQLQQDFQKKVQHEKDKLSIEIADMQAQLAEQQQQAKSAQQRELELRKQTRELEQQKQQMDLELARRVDEQKGVLTEQLRQQMHEEYHLQLQERERKLESFRNEIAQLKRKSEVGSQEAQGEVFEDDLENALRQQFPQDLFSPVAKGVRGADILQEVRDEMLESCGQIIWEAKNTKNYSQQWIEKLKDDQRQCGAKIAVLVTVALPPEVKNFAQIEGVWVCNANSYLALTVALRQHLIELNFARRSARGKSAKVELVYEYLSGDEFKSRIEAIVESFNSMQGQLLKERRAMEKIWKEREKQIQRITLNTVGMYGEMRGLMGSKVAQIPALELDEDDIEEV